MNDPRGEWLTILVCGGGSLLVAIVTVVIGTQLRSKLASQVRSNQKDRLSRNPAFGKQQAGLMLVQAVTLVVFVAAAALVLITKSPVAMTAALVAIVVLVVCAIQRDRLTTKGM